MKDPADISSASMKASRAPASPGYSLTCKKHRRYSANEVPPTDCIRDPHDSSEVCKLNLQMPCNVATSPLRRWGCMQHACRDADNLLDVFWETTRHYRVFEASCS